MVSEPEAGATQDPRRYGTLRELLVREDRLKPNPVGGQVRNNKVWSQEMLVMLRKDGVLQGDESY